MVWNQSNCTSCGFYFFVKNRKCVLCKFDQGLDRISPFALLRSLICRITSCSKLCRVSLKCMSVLYPFLVLLQSRHCMIKPKNLVFLTLHYSHPQPIIFWGRNFIKPQSQKYDFDQCSMISKSDKSSYEYSSLSLHHNFFKNSWTQLANGKN